MEIKNPDIQNFLNHIYVKVSNIISLLDRHDLNCVFVFFFFFFFFFVFFLLLLFCDLTTLGDRHIAVSYMLLECVLVQVSFVVVVVVVCACAHVCKFQVFVINEKLFSVHSFLRTFATISTRRVLFSLSFLFFLFFVRGEGGGAGLRLFQEYFTNIEPIVQRWAKAGEPEEKPSVTVGDLFLANNLLKRCVSVKTLVTCVL